MRWCQINCLLLHSDSSSSSSSPYSSWTSSCSISSVDFLFVHLGFPSISIFHSRWFPFVTIYFLRWWRYLELNNFGVFFQIKKTCYKEDHVFTRNFQTAHEKSMTKQSNIWILVSGCEPMGPRLKLIQTILKSSHAVPCAVSSWNMFIYFNSRCSRELQPIDLFLSKI